MSAIMQPCPPQHLDLKAITYSSLRLGLFGISIFGETQTDTVDTVTLICGGFVSFALEHMSEMTPAVGTNNLCSLHAEGAVDMSGHSAGN